MTTPLIAAALCALSVLSLGTVQAQTVENPWQVRVRAVHLDSADKDSTGLDLSLSRKTIPEFDISYFFTPHWAAELILTYPQKHKLYAGGARIGSLKHLPPTLTVQYHFLPQAQWRPYVGAGLNYTRFSGVRFEPAVQDALSPSIEKSSVGLALQAGIDVMLDKQWSINVDVKKLQLRTDVRSAGTKVGEFKVDPWLVGVGVGFRF